MQSGHIITIVTVGENFKKEQEFVDLKEKGGGGGGGQLIWQVVWIAFIKIYRIQFDTNT